MKYRIIRFEKKNKIWYQIQYKFLFCWFYITNISDLVGIYNMSFESMEDAEEYLSNQNESVKETIIKEYNY